MSVGIGFLGTILKNRRGLPKGGIIQKNSKIPRGTIKQMSKPFPEGSLYFVAWMDKKPVHFLSTMASNKFCVRRKIKQAGSGYKNIRVRAPTVIPPYNGGMGGTDLCDQFLSYYINAMRSAKWQIRIFLFFLLLCALNAHILYKKQKNLERGDPGYRFKTFLEEVVTGLFAEARARQRGMPQEEEEEEEEEDEDESPRRRRRRDEDDVDDSPMIMKYARLETALLQQSNIPQGATHPPMKWSSRVPVHNKRGKIIRYEDHRPYCKLCLKRVSISCEDCKVGLCVEPKPGSTTSCWKVYHAP
jgi:hypothetical protein